MNKSFKLLLQIVAMFFVVMPINPMMASEAQSVTVRDRHEYASLAGEEIQEATGNKEEYTEVGLEQIFISVGMGCMLVSMIFSTLNPGWGARPYALTAFALSITVTMIADFDVAIIGLLSAAFASAVIVTFAGFQLPGFDIRKDRIVRYISASLYLALMGNGLYRSFV